MMHNLLVIGEHLAGGVTHDAAGDSSEHAEFDAGDKADGAADHGGDEKSTRHRDLGPAGLRVGFLQTFSLIVGLGFRRNSIGKTFLLNNLKLVRLRKQAGGRLFYDFVNTRGGPEMQRGLRILHTPRRNSLRR